MFAKFLYLLEGMEQNMTFPSVGHPMIYALLLSYEKVLWKFDCEC